MLVLVGCSAAENVVSDSPNITPDKKEDAVRTVVETREMVVELFTNKRNDFTTPKLLEDAYKSYPHDDVIHAIYHYNESMNMASFTGEEWNLKAISYAAKIPPDYSGAFADEIIPYVYNLLGDEWIESRSTSLMVDETVASLTIDDKVEILRFIEEQYAEFHSDTNADTKSGYSEHIWEITSEKFGLPIYSISEIWSDIEVITASASGLSG